MARVHVTRHAVERFQQRVSDVTEDEARENLSTPLICIAADFGSCDVRLPGGQRIVIRDHTIITVKPKPPRKRCKRGKP